MSTKAFDEGQRAAAKDIPADANPYEAGSPERAQWAEGHEDIASVEEASQGEGT